MNNYNEYICLFEVFNKENYKYKEILFKKIKDINEFIRILKYVDYIYDESWQIQLNLTPSGWDNDNVIVLLSGIIYSNVLRYKNKLELKEGNEFRDPKFDDETFLFLLNLINKNFNQNIIFKACKYPNAYLQFIHSKHIIINIFKMYDYFDLPKIIISCYTKSCIGAYENNFLIKHNYLVSKKL